MTDSIDWLGKSYPSERSLFDKLMDEDVPFTDDDLPEFLKKGYYDPVNDEDSSLATRKVTLLKDHKVEFPILGMSVFVQPDPDVPDDEARFAKLFTRSMCYQAKSVLEADLVVFAGGSDVDPVLYGETRHDTTYFDSKRDEVDMDLFLLCKEQGIPMLGICRGAQFLHVMNGGKLYQDIDGHNGPHSMFDLIAHQHIDRVSSVHHQSVRANVVGGMEIIATAAQSTERHLNAQESKIGEEADIEAFFYRDTCCLGIQGHPEYSGFPYFSSWCMDKIEEFIYCNPDFEWRDRVFRMKADLLAERQGFKAVMEKASKKAKEIKREKLTVTVEGPVSKEKK
jgi:gamma-glutamyl-gamma-aminobutyrate hydrolase PuuD